MPKTSKGSSKNKSSRSLGQADESARHIINYEPDSPTIRAMEAKKRVRWGFHIGACVLVLILLAAIGRATIREAFVKNPRFNLRQVRVTTQGPLSPQKIVKETGLTEGQNLLTINLREVRERIERLPEVRAATIAKDFEGRLNIEVSQRHPVAWIECRKQGIIPLKSGAAWLTDAEGVAIPCEADPAEYEKLPVIRAEALPVVQAGARIEHTQFNAALKLLAQRASRHDEDEEEIRSIDLPNPYALVARMGDGALITFGMDDLGAQLARFDRVKHEARQRNWDIATLNLIARNNIPVTFRNHSSLPVASPATPRLDRATR